MNVQPELMLIKGLQMMVYPSASLLQNRLLVAVRLKSPGN